MILSPVSGRTALRLTGLILAAHRGRHQQVGIRIVPQNLPDAINAAAQGFNLACSDAEADACW